MSYTISISGLEIDCNYASNYHLLDVNNFRYFVQIITDEKQTHNFSGTGKPSLNTNGMSVSKSLFILTVFGDDKNTILMPTIYLNDVTPYFGLTLNAFVNDDTNKIKLSTISSKTPDNIFIYNVDNSNNIVSKIGDMGTLVYMLMQPIGKNLCIDFTGNSQFADSSVNTKISTLLINTQLYNDIIKKTMPNYTTLGKQKDTQSTSSNNMLSIIILIILVVVIGIIGYFVYKYFKNKKAYSTD